MKIYVASSWKNIYQPRVVALLRGLGHQVYDFRHPQPGDYGFTWESVDAHWRSYLPEEKWDMLAHPVARRAHGLDMDALSWCTVCVLVLPAGRSSSWELGYAMGLGKLGIVYAPEPCDPELMFSMARVVTGKGDLIAALAEIG